MTLWSDHVTHHSRGSFHSKSHGRSSPVIFFPPTKIQHSVWKLTLELACTATLQRISVWFEVTSSASSITSTVRSGQLLLHGIIWLGLFWLKILRQALVIFRLRDCLLGFCLPGSYESCELHTICVCERQMTFEFRFLRPLRCFFSSPFALPIFVPSFPSLTGQLTDSK